MMEYRCTCSPIHARHALPFSAQLPAVMVLALTSFCLLRPRIRNTAQLRAGGKPGAILYTRKCLNPPVTIGRVWRCVPDTRHSNVLPPQPPTPLLPQSPFPPLPGFPPLPLQLFAKLQAGAYTPSHLSST